MHPAFSVIFFTTSSGAGYGLLFMLGMFNAQMDKSLEATIGISCSGLAIILITAGLLSSTAHLGHPERAWRAFSQWRSSWLSREGVLAILTYIPAIMLPVSFYFPEDLAWKGWGLIAAILSAGTVICTGMIYASLKTIRPWDAWQVVPAYLSIAMLGGVLMVAFIAVIFDAYHPIYSWSTMGLAALVGFIKISFWRSADRNKNRSTAATATGLGGASAKVSLLDSPTTSENYIMREMGFVVARKYSKKLRKISGYSLFVIPALTAMLTVMIEGKAVIATLILCGIIAYSVGAIIERWLFFAEAKHVVTLYYGVKSV